MLMLMLMLCQYLRIASAGGVGLSFLVRFQANGRQWSCRTGDFPS